MNPNPQESRRHMEAALEFLDALDAQDLEALAKLWEQAESDPELERIFCEINQGVLEEQGLRPQWREYRQNVLNSLEQHLPSAFAQVPLTALTVGDIAARLASDDRIMRRLAPIDRQANARLQDDRTPLPAELGMKELLELTAQLAVAASAKYWREFQQVAVLASMSRGQAAAKAAARKAGKDPRARTPPVTKQESDGEKGSPQ